MADYRNTEVAHQDHIDDMKRVILGMSEFMQVRRCGPGDSGRICGMPRLCTPGDSWQQGSALSLYFAVAVYQPCVQVKHRGINVNIGESADRWLAGRDPWHKAL